MGIDIARSTAKTAQAIKVDVCVGDRRTFDTGHPLYEAGISYMDIQAASCGGGSSHVINVHTFGKMYVEFFSNIQFLPITVQGKNVLVKDGDNKCGLTIARCRQMPTEFSTVKRSNCSVRMLIISSVGEMLWKELRLAMGGLRFSVKLKV